MAFDYYSFRLKLVTDTIITEADFYQKNDYATIHQVNTYIHYLKNRIGTDREVRSTIVRDNAGNKKEIKKMDMNEYYRKMDHTTFNKQWSRLKEFHKIMKIKEYVYSLHHNSQKNIDHQNALIEQLCVGLKEKKFAKKKHQIVYDNVAMVIVNINVLHYNEDTQKYEINWAS